MVDCDPGVFMEGSDRWRLMLGPGEGTGEAGPGMGRKCEMISQMVREEREGVGNPNS
jgi:hypothetical protein